VEVKDACNLALHNRNDIEDDTDCGCYFCIRMFKGRDIEAWADGGNTAICPHCDIDAVIVNPTQEYLKEACEMFFSGLSETDLIDTGIT